MRTERWILVVGWWILAIGYSLSARAVDADSINRRAADPDFIHVSLVTLGPGDKVYSLYGHSALRLSCPAHQLDYCFTFEMALTAEEELKFLFSTAKAGFIAAPAQTFFDNYRREGRSIRERRLNLSPTEKQQLWKMLDNEMRQGAHWDYNFLTTNCSSMCVWIIEQALLTGGEQIVYGELPQAVTGTYRDLLNHISAGSDESAIRSWARLFWNLRMGTKGSERGELRDKLAPALLEEVWQQAVITDGAGHSRPVFSGGAETLAVQTRVARSDGFALFGRICRSTFGRLLPTGRKNPTVLIILLILILLTIVFIKKGKIMKRVFTSSKRMVLTAALVLTSALSAVAGGDSWYAYNIQADAYPTGAGLVYIDTETVEGDAIKYAESVNKQYVMTGLSVYGYGQAAEGWQFLGFTKGEIGEDGQVTYPNTTVILPEEGSPAFLTLVPEEGDGVGSKHYDDASGEEVSDDSLTVAALMPLDPSVYYRALFTHVAGEVADGQEAIGAVLIDKLCNEIGDQVTLTAIIDTDFSEFCTFKNWTLDGVVVSDEPTLTVEVTGAATYVANFSDTRSVTLSFPEEGGYVEWYNAYDFGLSYKAFSYVPSVYEGFDNELVDKTAANFLNIETSGYSVSGKTPAILYGAGEVTLYPSSAEEAEEPYGVSLFKWSGEAGVNVADLDQTADKYYTFDAAKGAFNLITEGTIDANRVYMQLPDSLVAEGLTTPETIYISEEAYTAANPSAISGAKVNAAAAGKVYDLQGRRLNAINREGIYILDGKKVIYRKK